jgi:hypothetical protein
VGQNRENGLNGGGQVIECDGWNLEPGREF